MDNSIKPMTFELKDLVGTEKNLRLSEYYLKMAVDAGLQRAKVKFEQYKDTYESEIEK